MYEKGELKQEKEEQELEKEQGHELKEEKYLFETLKCCVMIVASDTQHSTGHTKHRYV